MTIFLVLLGLALGFLGGIIAITRFVPRWNPNAAFRRVDRNSA